MRDVREARTIKALVIRVDRHELWQVQLFSQFLNENGTKVLIFTAKLLSFSHIESIKMFRILGRVCMNGVHA